MYLEKPLASTLEDATAVREAWRAHRRSPSPSGSTRGSIRCCVRMRDQLRDGRIGEPRMMRCAFTVAARYDGSWRHHAAHGGGVLHDLASHHVDLARYLLDREIVRRQRDRARPHADGSETLAATGELDGGVVLSATWASGTIDDDVVEVVGTEGAVRLSRYEDLTLSASRPIGARRRRAPGAAPCRRLRRSPSASPGAVRPGTTRRLRRRSTTSSRPPSGRTAVVPGVDEGWHSARVVAAIAEAARTGRTVALD